MDGYKPGYEIGTCYAAVELDDSILRDKDNAKHYMGRGWYLAVVQSHEDGYHLIPIERDLGGRMESREVAETLALAMNQRLGLSARDVAIIIARNMSNQIGRRGA